MKVGRERRSTLAGIQQRLDDINHEQSLLHHIRRGLLGAGLIKYFNLEIGTPIEVKPYDSDWVPAIYEGMESNDYWLLLMYRPYTAKGALAKSLGRVTDPADVRLVPSNP